MYVMRERRIIPVQVGTASSLMATRSPAADVQFVDPWEPRVWRRHVRKETRAIFLETPVNPTCRVLDLRVAAQICDYVAVMSKGRVVEYGSAEQVFGAPKDDYTKALFAAAPGRHGEFGKFAA